MFNLIAKLYTKLDDKIFLYWYDRKLKREAKEKMIKQLELEEDMEALRRIAPNVFREDG